MPAQRSARDAAKEKSPIEVAMERLGRMALLGPRPDRLVTEVAHTLAGWAEQASAGKVADWTEELWEGMAGAVTAMEEGILDAGEKQTKLQDRQLAALRAARDALEDVHSRVAA